MSFSFFGILKGLLIQNEVDRTKQVIIQSSASATTGTNTTITTAQTANRVITVPDVTDTLAGITATQTLSNKTLDNTTVEAIKASNFTLEDATDTTKQAQFSAASITTATTRTYTLPDISDTLTTNTATQILTNKTIDAGSNTITNLTNANLSGTAAISNANLAAMNANTVKANVTGGSATPTDVSLLSSATASAVMIRDANANVDTNNFIEGYTTTPTAASTTALTVASTYTQIFTGTTTQTVTLPDCTTLTLGQQFYIANRSTGVVTVNDNSSSLVQTLATITSGIFTCTNTGSAAGTWDVAYTANNALSNPMTTGGDIIYGGASGTPTRLANGSSGQVLTSSGGTSAPSWATLTAPSLSAYASTGTVAGYVFACGAVSVAPSPGDTYTNNSNTYTYVGVVSTGGVNYFWFTGLSAPQSSGNLTRVTGSGDAVIAFTYAQTFSTYTTPVGTKTLKVTAVGGGGGGGGTNSSVGQAGSAGGGGGGGAMIKYISSPGATYYYTVDPGGAGGTAGTNNGITGTFSAFGSGSTWYIAFGGQGGGGSGTSAGTGVEGSAGLGGSALNGDLNFYGSAGGFGLVFAGVSPLSGFGGGSFMGGITPSASTSGTATGINANAYGSGGSGGCEFNGNGSAGGGNGYSGLIMIEEYAQ